jgi:phage/plasmid-associated DNA primase
MLPAIDKLEGMDAIINRMIILFFPISIAKEEQDLQLQDKLFDERNVICSLALKELHRLQKNNFVFVEPLDSYKVKEQLLAKAKAFDEFIGENFEFDSEGRIYTATLYDMFKKYCEVNFYDVKISKTQFLQKICAIQGVEKKKIRVNGGKPLNGIVGLKIKKYLYDNPQDSEM